MLQGGPPLTADAAVVFALIAAAVALFVTEAIPTDTTAIAVLVSLVILRGFTHVSPEEAISGFSSPATVTIVAMYVLSAGVEQTGVVERLEVAVARFTIAVSTAFMTPMGYQTNLMVYSPGGYRFTDFVRVGAPLQVLLAVVTTLGIAAIWGV